MNTVLVFVLSVFLLQCGFPPNSHVFNLPIATIGINYVEHGGNLELPIHGATGWAAVSMPMRSEPNQRADVVSNLAPGQGFTILKEYGEWWNVLLSSADSNYAVSGWVLHRKCFINLPDIVPSVVFDITNAYSSLKRSSSYEIPNITGYTLYEAWAFNYRLGRYEFIVPVLYSTGRRIFEAQQAALADGNTIIIYEAFRPRTTQQSVVSNLRDLMDSNARVRRNINAPPWGLNWFIATGVSNHQRGVAIDAGLGRIVSYETRMSGIFSYTHVTAVERFVMPTQMHELSPQAVAFSRPVSSTSPDAWRTIMPAYSMTEGAMLLQYYLTNAGFTPLASEWWHFNDLEGARIANEIGIRGEFFTTTVYSQTPRHPLIPCLSCGRRKK